MENDPVKCHWHSEVIIEQRTAGGIGRGGGTSMQASKQERNNGRKTKRKEGGEQGKGSPFHVQNLFRSLKTIFAA